MSLSEYEQFVFDAGLLHLDDPAEAWRYPAYFVGWVMWNWLPAPGGPMEFGTGDTPHHTNRLPLYLLYGHLAQLRHLYGRLEPDCAALARWMQGQLPERQRRHPVTGPYPWYPFLMTRIDRSPRAKPPSQSWEAPGVPAKPGLSTIRIVIQESPPSTDTSV